MKRYIFKEQEIKKEYQYIFLCGSHYKSGDKRDKRNVLRDFLKNNNLSYRPIILEDYFDFQKKSSRFLFYDDIYMKDLYQVEMLMNVLSDNIIIIHESISTAAETGLFLSDKGAIPKTCLLLPDETAVEESKMGQFIQLAFLQEPNAVKAIKFYPRVEKNILSNDVSYWHTYFYEDKIGQNLGDQILEFLTKSNVSPGIRFTKTMEKVEDGYIHYKVKDHCLDITILPRTLLNCVAAVLSIHSLAKMVFGAGKKELKEYIECIKRSLSDVFTHTIEEKMGGDIQQCNIHVKMNVDRVYIASVIGMILYLFQAAGFLEIVKADDHDVSNKVEITRKMVTYQDGTQHFFYERYSDCIVDTVSTQIV